MNTDGNVDTTDAGALVDSQPVTSASASATVPAPSANEANPEAPPLTDDEVIALLATLQPMDYDRIRKEEAKALGIQVKTLDDMVKAARNDNAVQTRSPFGELEAWPDPVDPAVLFDELTDIIHRHVVLDSEQADTAALWSAHTHLTDVFDISPILNINAPEKECAKTLLQTLLGRVVYRPLPASNASLSALFRAVETWKPTILIDEADTFFRDNPELHGMVNAGYKQGGFILRSEAVGDNFEPRMFSVYCAKSIAGIALEKHLPDSTMSRCIVLNLRRKLPHEKVERMRSADPLLFERIAAKLARFANDYSKQVRLAQPPLPEELSDRSQDNWEPLLAIASCAGPVWLKRATDAALKLSGASEQSASTGNELLADIREIISGWQDQRIRTADLIAMLVADSEKSWGTYNRGKPLSPRQLAKQLAVYGIKPKTVRLAANNTPKGYELSEFRDAFDRYLSAPEKDSPQRNGSQKAMAGMAEDVADTPQPLAGDVSGGVLDDPLPFHIDAATLEVLPLLEGGGVADKPESLGGDPDADPDSVF